MSIPGAGAGDRDKWMTMFSTLDDDEVEALLDARALPTDSELDDLACVARRLRASAEREPVPPMSAALRAQIAQAYVGTLPSRAAQRSLRRGVAAAAVAAVVALVGVGAEQNRLPADVQDVMSSMAELVGVDVPRVDERPSHGGDADGSHSNSGGSGQDSSDDPADDAEDRTGRDEGQGVGPDGTTPGGATPADPGEPGDKEPATPATPPDKSSGGASDSTPGTTPPGPVAPTGGGDAGAGTDSDAGTDIPAPNPNANPNASGADTETPAVTAPGRAKDR